MSGSTTNSLQMPLLSNSEEQRLMTPSEFTEIEIPIRNNGRRYCVANCVDSVFQCITTTAKGCLGWLAKRAGRAVTLVGAAGSGTSVYFMLANTPDPNNPADPRQVPYMLSKTGLIISGGVTGLGLYLMAEQGRKERAEKAAQEESHPLPTVAIELSAVAHQENTTELPSIIDATLDESSLKPPVRKTDSPPGSDFSDSTSTSVSRGGDSPPIELFIHPEKPPTSTSLDQPLAEEPRTVEVKLLNLEEEQQNEGCCAFVAKKLTTLWGYLKGTSLEEKSADFLDALQGKYAVDAHLLMALGITGNLGVPMSIACKLAASMSGGVYLSYSVKDLTNELRKSKYEYLPAENNSDIEHNQTQISPILQASLVKKIKDFFIHNYDTILFTSTGLILLATSPRPIIDIALSQGGPAIQASLGIAWSMSGAARIVVNWTHALANFLEKKDWYGKTLVKGVAYVISQSAPSLILGIVLPEYIHSASLSRPFLLGVGQGVTAEAQGCLFKEQQLAKVTHNPTNTLIQQSTAEKVWNFFSRYGTSIVYLGGIPLGFFCLSSPDLAILCGSYVIGDIVFTWVKEAADAGWKLAKLTDKVATKAGAINLFVLGETMGYAGITFVKPAYIILAAGTFGNFKAQFKVKEDKKESTEALLATPF